MTQYTPIYPGLPQGATPDASDFRIHKSSTEIDKIGAYGDKHENTSKKYSKAISGFEKVATVSGSISAGSGAAAIATGATGVGIPIAAALGGVSLISGTVSVICGFILKRLKKKERKHIELTMASRTTYLHLARWMAKSIEDGKISDEEFSKLINEVEKHGEICAEIRGKAREAVKNEISEEEKAKIRAEVVKELQSAISLAGVSSK